MKTEEMEALVEQNERLRDYLFPRGYFVTNDANVDAKAYPFFGKWVVFGFCGYSFFVHPKQRFYTIKTELTGLALLGHAYNPVMYEKNVSEKEILECALSFYEKDEKLFTDYFNQWSGVFTLFVFTSNSVRIYGDATGALITFYGTCNGKHYCSSHSNLLGDICGLEFDPYIKRLIKYRFYPLFGSALPGDLSPYLQFKRLIPNHFVEFQNGEWSIHRFFPTKANALFDISYDELIEQASGILSNSMRIIPQKWNKPAISLTGGCDSKTTLACANEVYDKYEYFSYCSSDSEAVDAEAASKICKTLNLPHKTYHISKENKDFSGISDFSAIMDYNVGSIGKNNENDVRKRAYFLSIDDFDIEVKSWVSEIARAYYHKRFSKKKFPNKLTPRYATSLYKVFFTNRKLVQDTDKVFEDFLQTYYSNDEFNQIPWYDLFFWEFRFSSWNGLVITGEQKIAYDITIPYNNRVLLQLLLSTPVEKRIKDEPHWDIMRKMNHKIADCGVSVVNIKHTSNRAKLEKLYLEVFSRLPF